MKIETKYNIGDKIEYKKVIKEDVKVPCDFCGGAGEIENVAHVVVSCPACDGCGHTWEEQAVLTKKRGYIQEIVVNKSGIEYVLGSWYNNVPEENVIRVLPKDAPLYITDSDES